jgi:hypothetical protein
MLPFEQAFQSAIDEGLLPGVIMTATNSDRLSTQPFPIPYVCRLKLMMLLPDSFTYERCLGTCSSEPPKSDRPLQTSTILSIASCTKLYTAVAALQCVEKGIFTLDEDVARWLPELGTETRILTAVDAANQTATFEPKRGPITLR